MQQESTNLKPEVPPFIPNRRHSMANYPDSNVLPTYVTSCYPFVQENNKRVVPFEQQWQLNTQNNTSGYGVSMFTNLNYSNNGHGQMMMTNPSMGMVPWMSYIHQQQYFEPHKRTIYPMSSQNQRFQQRRTANKKHLHRNNRKQSKISILSEKNDTCRKDFSQQTDFPLGITNLLLKDQPSSLFDENNLTYSDANMKSQKSEQSSDSSDETYSKSFLNDFISISSDERFFVNELKYISRAVQFEPKYTMLSEQSTQPTISVNPPSACTNQSKKSGQIIMYSSSIEIKDSKTNCNYDNKSQKERKEESKKVGLSTSSLDKQLDIKQIQNCNNDEAVSNSMTTSSQNSHQPFLHLNSEEFPDLDHISLNTPSQSQHHNKFSYSAVLSGGIPKNMRLTNKASFNKTPSVVGVKEVTKLNQAKSKKRLKKAEKATQEANKEYAEISSEQESLKTALTKSITKKKEAPRSRNKKPSTSIVVNLNDVIDRLEKQKISLKAAKNEVPRRNTSSNKIGVKNQKTRVPSNALDGSAPLVMRRGKEREGPKVKKPSALKKVILKEREKKKEERLKNLLTMEAPPTDVPQYPPSLLSSSDTVMPSSGGDEECDAEEKICEKSNSLLASSEQIASTVPQIHSRRYREYCCQTLEKGIDKICSEILERLVFFQDRSFKNDPIKAKSKRRYVLGLREVTKHLKLRKLKCVIISPNLEKIQSKGGLDDALNNILSICQEQKVTYVFALGRKALGCAVGKLVPVSIVGVFDFSGTEGKYKELISLVRDAQDRYQEMISIYQHEITTSSDITSVTNPASASRRFAHMSHSRNPSATSCLSFASFISEPISELNEASNWRMLMDQITDSSALPPTCEDSSITPHSKEDQNETNENDTKNEAAKDDLKPFCPPVNETGDLKPFQAPNDDVIEEKVPIKNIDEEDSRQRISCWLENTSQLTKHPLDM